ncbi:acyl-CoA dehydrogenase [Terasakiella pusilla]|uniref:acyl-CoA dehydrogenase n=1 Tax=Terasakiella pusilla TaxID=64973 RepID=UPI00048DCD6B|nr:acyl-CoA dehydrogenase [Terasakiella pusilla]
MSEYNAPLDDIKFVVKHLVDFAKIQEKSANDNLDWDVLDAVLEEAAKLSKNVLAPLNMVGDTQGSRIEDGKVITPDGWKEAYKAVTEGGWIGLGCSEEFGGQGFPETIAGTVSEMFQSANLAFSLWPLLNQGGGNAIENHASQGLKDLYLPKMFSGEWTGTMNLTEPQAGSDLAAVRTKAVPNGDHYLISGSKIFISYGDHDMADNIVHLVLARTPDAPEGVRGISLFIVPKILVNEDGSLGQPNDLRAVSLEHKMGIHASPTCVMAYGDNDGAIGYLVGEENRGLEYMFVMMNRARFEVGMQGVSLSERAYQHALAYAKDRVQGVPFNGKPGDTIIKHPDVRRLLMHMKSQTQAMRALTYLGGALLDLAHLESNETRQKDYQGEAEFLTPIIKAWCTERGQEMTSLGVQIHGGLGFIEETGAAQYYRDARITTIYEGTTAIQANDFAFRKTLRDEGATARRLLSKWEGEVKAISDPALQVNKEKVLKSLGYCATALDLLKKRAAANPAQIASTAVAYLDIWGYTIGAYLMVKSAAIAQQELTAADANKPFLTAKIACADFYITHILPQAEANLSIVMNGVDAVWGLSDDQF